VKLLTTSAILFIAPEGIHISGEHFSFLFFFVGKKISSPGIQQSTFDCECTIEHRKFTHKIFYFNTNFSRIKSYWHSSKKYCNNNFLFICLKHNLFLWGLLTLFSFHFSLFFLSTLIHSSCTTMIFIFRNFHSTRDSDYFIDNIICHVEWKVFEILIDNIDKLSRHFHIGIVQYQAGVVVIVFQAIWTSCTIYSTSK
jgi:hypothetical protein